MEWETASGRYSSGKRLMIGRIKVASVYSDMCGKMVGEILLPGFKKEFTRGTFANEQEAIAFCDVRVKRWLELIDEARNGGDK